MLRFEAHFYAIPFPSDSTLGNNFAPVSESRPRPGLDDSEISEPQRRPCGR
jgi:hypothetical protein